MFELSPLEQERQAAIAKKEAARVGPEATLLKLYETYNAARATKISETETADIIAAKTQEAKNNLVAYMIENRGYAGPAEGFIASQKLFTTAPEIYQEYVRLHTEINKGTLSQSEQEAIQNRVTSIEVVGKGITGDQSPAKAQLNSAAIG